jgi:tRNA A-37 threonylcarbamoyl transferase component Bud32/membrane-associated phospholipid phosphatase
VAGRRTNRVASRERQDDVGEAGEFAGIKLGERRRRPSGEREPLPIRLRTSGMVWAGLFVLVLLAWVTVYASNVPEPAVERLDDDILSLVVRIRAAPLTAAARGLAALGSVWTILFVRWLTIGLLAVFRRWRHLLTFVGCVFALRTLVAVMTEVFGRPRPPGVTILGDWGGYSHPSRPVAALAVALVGAGFALAPKGGWRTWAFRAAGAAIILLALARLYLAVDHPSDVLIAVVLGVAFAVVAFRVWCPDAIFPVTYQGGSPAHLELDERRTAAITEALREQLGVDAAALESLASEGAGGSTPLLIKVKGKGEPRLFAKLYAESHLRADRWYKLGRTILYGALEDEVAFNSVRQLVEYEDYMLRLMRDAGIPTPQPLGIAEVIPEREYLIVTEYLERSEQADEAKVDDSVIDEALEIVRRLWRAGLAHRDIKPENVLIRGNDVLLIDVAFAQVRPSPWRQAVDLANMMLLLALSTDANCIYDRAVQRFEPEEVAEAFAATRGITIPATLRSAQREDGRDLVAEFRKLAPARKRIAIQRWSIRRLLLTVRTAATVGIVVVLVLVNLANLGAP